MYAAPPPAPELATPPLVSLLQEVHDSLCSVEAEAERLFASERALMDGDTADRDRLYARAQAVSGALGVLASELTRSVEQVNELASASLGDASTPMGSVVRVLNGQLQALGQLEGRIDDLGGQLDALRLAGGGGTSLIRAA
jgi:nuclear pore complex protein Nup62